MASLPLGLYPVYIDGKRCTADFFQWLCRHGLKCDDSQMVSLGQAGHDKLSIDDAHTLALSVVKLPFDEPWILGILRAAISSRIKISKYYKSLKRKLRGKNWEDDNNTHAYFTWKLRQIANAIDAANIKHSSKADATRFRRINRKRPVQEGEAGLTEHAKVLSLSEWLANGMDYSTGSDSDEDFEEMPDEVVLNDSNSHLSNKPALQVLDPLIAQGLLMYGVAMKEADDIRVRVLRPTWTKMMKGKISPVLAMRITEFVLAVASSCFNIAYKACGMQLSIRGVGTGHEEVFGLSAMNTKTAQRTMCADGQAFMDRMNCVVHGLPSSRESFTTIASPASMTFTDKIISLLPELHRLATLNQANQLDDLMDECTLFLLTVVKLPQSPKASITNCYRACVLIDIYSIMQKMPQSVVEQFKQYYEKRIACISEAETRWGNMKVSVAFTLPHSDLDVDSTAPTNADGLHFPRSLFSLDTSTQPNLESAGWNLKSLPRDNGRVPAVFVSDALFGIAPCLVARHLSLVQFRDYDVGCQHWLNRQWLGTCAAIAYTAGRTKGGLSVTWPSMERLIASQVSSSWQPNALSELQEPRSLSDALEFYNDIALSIAKMSHLGFTVPRVYETPELARQAIVDCSVLSKIDHRLCDDSSISAKVFKDKQLTITESLIAFVPYLAIESALFDIGIIGFSLDCIEFLDAMVTVNDGYSPECTTLATRLFSIFRGLSMLEVPQNFRGLLRYNAQRSAIMKEYGDSMKKAMASFKLESGYPTVV